MNDSANVTTLKTISEPDYNKIDNIAVIYYYSNEYIHNVSVSPFKEIQQYAPPPLSFFSKLYLITDGECTIRINKKMYTCRKNDLILIPANIKMDFVEMHNVRWYWIHFNVMFKINTKYADLFNNFTDNFVLRANNDFVHNYVKEIHLHSHLNSPIDEFMVKCNLMQLIRYYIVNANLTPTVTTINSPLYNINQYMIEHIRTGINIEALAKVVNLNENYFIRWFKKQTGYAPLQYYNYRKIELARGMLDHTDRSISEILESLGFLDHSYFSRLFKKLVGVSPSEYRRSSIYRSNITPTPDRKKKVNLPK